MRPVSASALTRQLRVAFFDIGGTTWTAGPHYLKNLFLAIKSLDGPASIEIALLVTNGTAPGTENAGLPVDQRIAVPLWHRAVLRLQQRLGIRLPIDPPLATLLRRRQVNAVFANRDFGPQFPIASLSWIPDFQHVRLPEMFSAPEVRRRDREFSRIAAHATRVIVSSRDACADFQRFAPHAANKARVLPFVAHVPPEIYDADPAQVSAQYGLPPSFIYLPNQFWKHKNHAVVVHALRLAKARHPGITVVCSGRTTDDRHPGYFPELQDTIAAFGLRSMLIILGVIPHAHVFQLMRQSLAVLQPSLFEGWSTSVEEAKSLGKRVLLSDIPVHREQAPPHGVYFDPRDPETLARCLSAAFTEYSPGPDLTLEAAARSQLPARTKQFGERFATIVLEAVSPSNVASPLTPVRERSLPDA